MTQEAVEAAKKWCKDHTLPNEWYRDKDNKIDFIRRALSIALSDLQRAIPEAQEAMMTARDVRPPVTDIEEARIKKWCKDHSLP